MKKERNVVDGGFRVASRRALAQRALLQGAVAVREDGSDGAEKDRAAHLREVPMARSESRVPRALPQIPEAQPLGTQRFAVLFSLFAFSHDRSALMFAYFAQLNRLSCDEYLF